MAEETDKYEDDMDKMIDTGKEKGYLTYGEVNDLLPGDVTTPDDLDDLLTTINTQGIDVLSGESKFGGDRDKYEPEAGEESEDVELDLTPGTLEKTNDPVRMYLREMGTVPLLTREGEVEIAKRIERGQLRVMKAISRSPIVIRKTGFPSESFPGQTIYHLRCTHCGHDYGANGSDIHKRRCPRHQEGIKGERLRDPAPNLFSSENV